MNNFCKYLERDHQYTRSAIVRNFSLARVTNIPKYNTLGAILSPDRHFLYFYIHECEYMNISNLNSVAMLTSFCLLFNCSICILRIGHDLISYYVTFYSYIFVKKRYELLNWILKNSLPKKLTKWVSIHFFVQAIDSKELHWLNWNY